MAHLHDRVYLMTFGGFCLTVEYGDWFDYALEFEREMDKGDYNIHLVYFEDLKEVISFIMYLRVYCLFIITSRY